MIINVGPVLIGAYEKSVRPGKYGYDGWLSPGGLTVDSGRGWSVLGLGAVCALTVVTVSTVHTAITRWSPNTLPACPAVSASRTDSLM